MSQAVNAVAPGRRSIVAPTLESHGPSLAKFVVVCVGSTFVNGGVLGVLFLVALLLGGVLSDGHADDTVSTDEKTEMEDTQKDYDLTNNDIGNDDTVPLNYNNDNIQDVSVPGPVDLTQSVGIQNAPEAPPMNVPPPAGTGNGTGAARLDPNVSGTGSSIGTHGGMGGPLGVGGGFGGRSGATREKMVKEGGGNAASEAAVASGLRFLALHQCSDGRWTLHDFNRHARTEALPRGKVSPDNSQPMTTRRNDVAATAFGLLPFLASGIPHKPATKKQKYDYTKGVGMGLRWLISRQSKSGNDRGYFGGDMYSHGLATIAMCEAYGLTSDPLLKASAQMAVDYIARAQHEGGGWRYAPRQAGDMSVTGWQVMALKSGQMSGLSVPRVTLKRVERFLDDCESGGKSINDKGGYSYTPRSGPTPAMTAVGALCRQYLGVPARNPSLRASVKRIRAVPPQPRGNIYYEYYATQVMHHMGAEDWEFWNKGPDGSGKGGIRDTLITRQDQGLGGRPGQKGSFEGNEHVGGRLGGTSLNLLSLEVYYRHLPLYRRDVGAVKKND